MRRWTTGLLALLVGLAFSAPAFAQGGGASSTGTIQGRVVDAQGAVLPGVTVSATSPVGVGRADDGHVGDGQLPLSCASPGRIRAQLRAGRASTRSSATAITISLGFTANVNVELALATLQETVTVSGASPVIDTTATRTVQNFKLEQLQSLPNGRDMWALLAVTPGVAMSRIDVGGNRAGTQTGYTAYGMSGQVRVLIEGINSTEGTTGAGFYFDYSSLEEVFLGTTGQSAEMPNPGVQSQFIAKSGGNQFNGEYYLDWYNNSLQGSNIPDEYTAPTAFRNNPIRAAQQRDRSLLRHGDQRRRPDQEGQDLVVRRPTGRSSTRFSSRISSSTRPSTPSSGMRLARAPTRSTRSTRSSVTTSGARRFSPTGCRRPPTRISTRARPTARTRAAGSTRPSGTARSATSSISKPATATSATTSRRSPTAPSRITSAIRAHWKSPGRIRRTRTIAIASSGTLPRPTSSTARRAATRSRWAPKC